MVHPELERAAFHLEPEVPDGTEGSQKLPVESAVVGLIADRCRAAPTWVALASATRARNGGEAVLGHVESSQHGG